MPTSDIPIDGNIVGTAGGVAAWFEDGGGYSYMIVDGNVIKHDEVNEPEKKKPKIYCIKNIITYIISFIK